MDGSENSKGNSESGTAVSESGSKLDNGTGKPIGTNAGVEGFIDPTLARDTAGQSAGKPAGTGDTESASNPGASPRPRGRPRKDGQPAGTVTASTIKPEAKARNISVNGIEKLLFSIHQIGAATLSIPELELTKEEAKKLGDAIEGVNEHFKLSLDPKTAAMIELAQVAGVIYVPRGVALYLRKKMERQMRPPVSKPAPNDASPVDMVSPKVAGMVFDPVNQKIVN